MLVQRHVGLGSPWVTRSSHSAAAAGFPSLCAPPVSERFARLAARVRISH